MGAVVKAARLTTLDTVLNTEAVAGQEATVLMEEAALCLVLVAVAMVAQTQKQAAKAGHGEHTRQALEPTVEQVGAITLELLASATRLVVAEEAAAEEATVQQVVTARQADFQAEAAVAGEKVAERIVVTAVMVHWESLGYGHIR